MTDVLIFFMKHTTTGITKDSLLMEFFINQLKDIYWAEKHLAKALPKMEAKATTDELSRAFAVHLKETKEHASRLERIFEMIGEKPEAKKCHAMNGIIEEAENIISETKNGTMTQDAGLIFAAQKAEHYEIATYGGLITLAKTLLLPDVAKLLVQTIQEEKNADEKLSDLGEAHINLAASIEKA